MPFPFTAGEICLLGAQAAAARGGGNPHQVVEEVLSLLDLRAFVDRIVTTLSSGELERVLVARAIAQVWGQTGERLLLLDEPTAKLDLVHQHTMMRALQAAAGVGASPC